MANLLSQKISIPSSYFSQTSSSILLHQIAWEVSKPAETYSASVDDCTTLCCFFDAQENNPEPKENAYSEVLSYHSAATPITITKTKQFHS